jgi:formylglycine-generating enzyme required for sulfatase activity
VLAGIAGAVVVLVVVLAIAVMARQPSSVALAPTSTTVASASPTAVPTSAPTSMTAASRPPTAVPTATPLIIVVTATPIPTPTATVTPRYTPTPYAGEERVIGGAPMVFVPAGDFIMGSSIGDSDEQPVHTVYLDAFWIDKYEVTNAQYKRCVDAGKCSMPLSTQSETRRTYYGDPSYENYPVVAVSWNDAKTFCEWVGKRLPTEAEWEKAARGTDARVYPWGNQFDKTKANVGEGSQGDTTAVGSYPTGASPYGVMDLAGNVWEWVQDWYDPNYYRTSPRNNPMGPPSGTYRTIRGGGWPKQFTWSVGYLKGLWRGPVDFSGRSSFRYVLFPDARFLWLGFRCAKAP